MGASAAQSIARARLAGRAVPWILEFPCTHSSVFDFVPSFTEFPVMYWRSVDRRLELAACGISGTITKPSHTDDDNVITFFARRFDLTTSPGKLWQAYPPEIGWIPKTIVVRQDNRTHIRHCLMVSPDSNESELMASMERLAIPTPSSPSDAPVPPPPPVENIIHHPEKSGWQEGVETILRAIQSGRIEKAVLARRSDYQFTSRIDPLEMMRHLFAANEKTGVILYFPSPESAFISFTPERLFRRQGTTLKLEAISSTIRRHPDDAEDTRQAELLLRDDKARREHQFVITGIIDSIKSISRTVPEVGRTGILSLDRVHHLMTPISAQLREGPCDNTIIDLLHPTPAVGGTPTAEALSLLRRIEPFDRGWYAAPIGYQFGEEAEFAVAIRSALVHNNRVSVFSGAGIVAGSDPDAEWEEIDAKDILRPLMTPRGLK